MASTLANALDFFRDFGIFDVILPFLLVFTVVYATLQKTKILGKDQANLDSMVAFVIGLLVVAATKVVGIINEALPQVMVLVIVGLSFLMMIGIFANPEKSFFEELTPGFKYGLMIVMSFAVVLIFLGTIKNSKGESWLEFAWNFTINNWNGAVVGSLIFLLVIVGAIWFIIGGKKETNKDK